MMSSDSSLVCASLHIQTCQISPNSLGRGGDFLEVFLFVLESHLIKMNSESLLFIYILVSKNTQTAHLEKEKFS